MSSFWSSFLVKLVLKIFENFIGWLRNKHEAANTKTVESQDKTITSVGESIEKEEEIRKDQADVDKKPSDVQKSNGTVDVGDWNAGK